MTIEFDCGTVQNSVGVPAMALASHIQTCKDPKCIEDCKKEIIKIKGFYSESN